MVFRDCGQLNQPVTDQRSYTAGSASCAALGLEKITSSFAVVPVTLKHEQQVEDVDIAVTVQITHANC